METSEEILSRVEKPEELNGAQVESTLEAPPPNVPRKNPDGPCDNVNFCVPDELLTLPASCPPDSNGINSTSTDISVAGAENISVPLNPTSVDVSNPVTLGALGDLNVYDSDPDDVPVEIPHNNVQKILPKNIVNLIPNKYRDIEQTDSDGSSSEDSDESSSDSESSSSSDEISPISESESVAEAQHKEAVIPRQKPPKTDGELQLDDLPPIEDLQISVTEKECMEVGKISAIVDRMVVVQALKNTPALDLDSVLFLDKGQRTLGRIFDVIGPVCEPAYCIRFNSGAHIQENGIEKNMAVYCAPKTDHTSYVFLGELLKMKGSDASWKANNEPPPQFVDYSDDEEEKRNRRRKRQADSGGGGACSTRDVVEPSSFERRMNAKNLARSQVPPGPPGPPGARQPPPQPPPMRGVGRGWSHPGVVIQNYHSAPPPPLEPLSYHAPPHPRRPGYTITRFGAQPAWPPSHQHVMPMFPNAIPPIPPPYQFGMGTGAFFSMPPPPLNHHAMPPNMFSSPPPPPPPNPFRHNPPY